MGFMFPPLISALKFNVDRATRRLLGVPSMVGVLRDEISNTILKFLGLVRIWSLMKLKSGLSGKH